MKVRTAARKPKARAADQKVKRPRALAKRPAPHKAGGAGKASSAKVKISQLSIGQLMPIAEQLVSASNEAEANALKRQFMEGFYGRPVRLSHA